MPAAPKYPKIEPLLRLAIPVIALGVILALLYFGRVFFVTAITAVIVSFILDPFVHLLVQIRFPRGLASLLVCLIAALILYALFLGLYVQTSGLVSQLPQITERIAGLVDGIQGQIEKVESGTYKLISRRQQPQPPVPKVAPLVRKRSAAPPPPQTLPTIQEVRIHQDNNPIADFLYPRLASLYEALLMASFVPFLVYFLLSWGDHMNRSFLLFFQGEDRVVASKSLQGIGDMVRAFVVGNSLLGVLLACASTIGFWFISLPFPLLAGPLSGFLSLFPYVGLPLALVPPLLAALGGPTNVSGIFIVVLIVASLHLFALNVLYPKLVGARVHLNPLVVTVALMFWSFLWDGAGLVLAIPLTAGIKAVCDNVRGLRPIGRFLGD